MSTFNRMSSNFFMAFSESEEFLKERSQEGKNISSKEIKSRLGQKRPEDRIRVKLFNQCAHVNGVKANTEFCGGGSNLHNTVLV